MAQRPSSLTKEDLVSATLPPATATYTVISHDFAITTIKEELEANGFTIEKEEYRGTAGAKVANGLFVITYGEDPDLAMSYSFTNSYDKSARFRAAIGAYVKANDSVIIANMDFWKRKHTGTADSETKELIKEHIQAYNVGLPIEDKIFETDLAEAIGDTLSTLITSISVYNIFWIFFPQA